MAVFELYRGEISGLLGALFFGTGNVVYRKTSEEMDIIPMNFFRTILGFLFFVTLTVITQNPTELLSLSRYVVLMLALSVFFNVAMGDTAYFKAQHTVGVSRAFPITNLLPLLTLFFAHFLLGEPLTERYFVGVLLVIGGVYFVTQLPKGKLIGLEMSSRRIGFGLAFLAALCWTFGTLTLRLSLSEIDAISANSVRYAFAILFLGLMSSRNGSVQKMGKYKRQTLKVVAIATIFNVMLGSLFWADSVKFAGATKSATLTATSPLFALPFSIKFLGESFSWKILLGTIMTICGIWLVI
ncbi:MAG: DMT family transporter [Candidatus Heimdallarchaeota archaeon]